MWGLFLGGTPVLTADVCELEYNHEYEIPDFPQEMGAFATYNKLQKPFDGRLRYVIGGTVSDRTQFLQQAEAICLNLTLYQVVMPENVYMSVNPIRLNFRRTSQQGVTMMLVDVYYKEVRVVNSSTFSNQTQTPAGAPAENGGTTQPTAPTDQQANSVPPTHAETPSSAASQAPGGGGGTSAQAAAQAPAPSNVPTSPAVATSPDGNAAGGHALPSGANASVPPEGGGEALGAAAQPTASVQ